MSSIRREDALELRISQVSFHVNLVNGTQVLHLALALTYKYIHNIAT